MIYHGFDTASFFVEHIRLTTNNAMRIGILTFQNNENKGAILQGWCLANIIQKLMPESEVEIVDYRTRSKEITRVRPFFITKQPKEIPKRVIDWRLCQKFIQRELPLSEKRILTDNNSKAEIQLQSLDYDLLVIGSDEVWKVHEPNAETRILYPNRPFPNLYFPSPNISAKKTSYAASANTLELDQLTDEQIYTMKTSLQDFDLISVRDRHTERVLDELGINNVFQVADPTVLQDIPEKDITKTLERNNIDPSSPIIGIHGLRKDNVEVICNRYREQGYQIVSPTISPHADINLKSKLDPFEYYSLYDYFDLLLTNSLHSTIFSIKQRTPFLTIDTSPVYKRTESKTKSLLRDFDLLHRHYDTVNGESETLLDAIRRCDTSLDEGTIIQSMTQLKEQSETYIQKLSDL